MKFRIATILITFTVFLSLMISIKQWTLNTGTVIVLETQPIDPRSLFRGDYVRLNYSISNLKPSTLEGDNNFKKHEKIYVALKQQGKYWVASSISHSKPGSNTLFLKGKVQYASESFWNQETGKSENIANINVKYGIENYFVPENEGLELERRDNDQIVDIRIAVDKFGKAGIKEVLVNNQSRYIERLF